MNTIYCPIIDEFIELNDEVIKQTQIEELDEKELNALISAWDFVW